MPAFTLIIIQAQAQDIFKVCAQRGYTTTMTPSWNSPRIHST